MNKVFNLILVLLFSITSTMAIPPAATKVNAYVINPGNNLIYLGGQFNNYNGSARSSLAAIDLNNNLQPWSPSILPLNSSVKSMHYFNDTVFVGGNFSQINSVSRPVLGAINANTGALLPWIPNLSNGLSTMSDANEMLMYNNFLIISDKNNGIYVIHRKTGAQISGASLPVQFQNMYNCRMKMISNHLVIASSFTSEVYIFTITTTATTFSATLKYIIPVGTDLGGFIEFVDIEVRQMSATTARLFLAVSDYNVNFPAEDAFAADSVVAYNFELLGFSIYSMQSWKAPLLDPSQCGAIPCYCNPNTLINQVYLNAGNNPFISGLVKNGNDVLIAGYRIAKNPNSCLFPSNYMSFLFQANATSFSGYDSLYRSNMYNPIIGFGKKMTVYAGRLFYITPVENIPGNMVNEVIGCYCLPPPKPTAFLTSNNPVCQGLSYNYSVASQSGIVEYKWNYSGTGVTIINNGLNNITVSYDFFATPGILSVKVKNDCGLFSIDSLTVNISFLPKPNASAGNDKYFTCVNNAVVLNGSSSTSNVTYEWTFSDNTITTNQNPICTADGNQILKVISVVNNCMNYDTTFVGYDTIKPITQNYNGNLELTCSVDSVIIDAQALYPMDTLHFTGSSYSSSNPAIIINTGLYLLQITDTGNGCVNYDTLQVTADYNPPAIFPPSSVDTITCSVDSVYIDGTAGSPSFLYWENPSGDTISNPGYADISGGYVLHAVDSSNGCEASAVILVNSFLTPPNISLPVNNPSINCSYSNAILDGSSLTPGAALSWEGPASFSSADPATVSITGDYILTVVHPQNGCIAKDTILVPYLPILIVNAGVDTTICPGQSVDLTAQPIGGTPPVNYSWSSSAGNTQMVTVMPLDTLEYFVFVTDGAGCIGKDSVFVNVPEPLADSLKAFQPCDASSSSGQIQVFAYNGVAPYQFSIDGTNFQSAQIFDSLSYGFYNILIKDALGCSKNDSISITTSSNLAEVNFLVSTEMYVSDTFVVVDISNPVPDTIIWEFPANCQVLDSSIYAPHIVNPDTGTFVITMHAFYGACEMIISKNVFVKPIDTSLASAYNNNAIKSVIIFPNPNSGIFDVNVELFNKQNFVIAIFDASGNEYFRQNYYEQMEVTQPINIQPVISGTYILKVWAEYDAELVIFIITE